jgi:hypothetical protein
LEGPASTVTVAPLQPPWTSFYFANTTAYTGSSCALADGKRDADDAYAGTASDSSFSFAASVLTLNFCTRSLKVKDSAPAGTTKVYAWATNSGGSSCTITAALNVNGGSAVYSGVATLPANSNTATALTWSFASAAWSFSNNDRVNVYFTTATGASCNSTIMLFGGTVRRSRLDLPNTGAGLPAGMPSPPTGLQGVANADGSKTLTWTAPSSGNPVAFYRIYRDGVDYTKRYDVTGDATPSYIDPSGDGIQHSYYVTAVSPNLAESSYVGPVTP